MNKSGWFFLFVLALMLSCSDEERELQKSVFISDPEAPELPLYTEWGYNTFGAYFDRTVLTSNEVDTPVKIIVKDGVTAFILQGDRRTGDYDSGEPVTLSIIIPQLNPERYSDLISLHKTSYNLKDAGEMVLITINGETFQPEQLEGEIEFIRAQHLIVDEKPLQIILSGKFNLKMIKDQVAITISDGRFDVAVGEVNFFKL